MTSIITLMSHKDGIEQVIGKSMKASGSNEHAGDLY